MSLLNKKNKEPEMIERDDGLTDYNVYIMSRNEKLFTMLFAAVICAAVAFVFYHNLIISALFALLCFKYPRIRARQIIRKRKQNLNMQFKDMLYSLASSLAAGKSIETAFRELTKDLQIIYPDPNTDIVREVEYIVRNLDMNVPVENAIAQFAERSHIEDIENFADVFIVSKKAGGNLADIIRTTSNIIGDKIAVMQEIETLITAKKFESRVLSVMPIGLVLLLSAASPDFMAPVFELGLGTIAMTIAIVMFSIAIIISEKIMNIEV